MIKKINCIKLSEKNVSESNDTVAVEEPLSIFINGRHFVHTMISPGMKKEFVIGHLFTETVIKDLDEIESLLIEENTVKVRISNPDRVLASKKNAVSGCGGGSWFLEELKLNEIDSNLRINAGDIFNGMKSILTSDFHRITGGVHSVGLFNNEGRICISEDIGRHNALDKVIGYGLIENIEFRDTFVACTGRISSEMVLKCSVANVPVVTSRGAVTSLANELAAKTGLCVIGFVRGEKMNIYTKSERMLVDSIKKTKPRGLRQ